MKSWSLRRVLITLLAVNLLLGTGLIALRSPVRATTVTEPRPELPAQVRQVTTAVNQGRHQERYEMRLTDQDLTSAIGYFLGSGRDIPFTKVQARTGDGVVVLDGVTKGMAVTVPVRAKAMMGARNGTPWMRVQDVSLGDTPVPGFVRDQILSSVNSSLDLSKYNLAVTVESIDVRPGVMTVRGVVK